MQRNHYAGSKEPVALLSREEILMIIPALDSEIGTYKEMLSDSLVGERARHRQLIEAYLDKLTKLHRECELYIRETNDPGNRNDD